MDVAALFRARSGRARASLARRLGDLDRAEDAVADAFVLALERWPRDGIPTDPAAWIVVTARRRAIDRLRRERRGAEKHALLARLDAAGWNSGNPDDAADAPFGDDRLALFFGCLHPALERDAQIALTLRAVGGLTTDEIADAFFVERTTMQQRLVRAKNKIRKAGIPFEIPRDADLGNRLDALASVVYLIFKAGYAPTRGPAVVRIDLCETAIDLGTLVARSLPDRAEPHALEALMRFHHARRETRADARGNVVLLADQDRSQWDPSQIARGSEALKRALRLPTCSLTYEAYIAATHVHAPTFEETDWAAIVAAYDALLALHDTPIVRCNRAVALAMNGDLARAHEAIVTIEGHAAMQRYRPYYLARGEIAERAGDARTALLAFERARALADEERDRNVIDTRIAAVRNALGA